MDSLQNIQPWQRFLARFTDQVFYYIANMMIFTSIVNLTGFAFSNVIVFFSYFLGSILVESLLIAKYRTTLGKWSLNLVVTDKNYNNLDFKTSLHRTFLVFIQGDGCGIPLFMIFTRSFAFYRLIKTKTTLWDSKIGSVISIENPTKIKKIVGFLMVSLSIIVFILLNFMVKQ